MEQIMKDAIKALQAAGSIINTFELDNSQIYEKGTANYVTQVDYNVEKFLIQELKKILPESNIIAEESATNQYDFQKPTWVLDPVDGTTNLMHSYNHSAISLALIIDKKPALGMIYNPYNGELFTAKAGHGAYLNGNKISVSSNATMEKSMICFGTSPYEKHKSEKVFSTTHKIFLACQDIRRSGSAALDIAYVACGRLDAFYEMNLKPWDYAAGVLIVREAGGQITDWLNEDPSFSNSSDILATNGKIHPLVLKIIE